MILIALILVGIFFAVTSRTMDEATRLLAYTMVAGVLAIIYILLREYNRGR